jgi:putative ABC transport system permease protein
MVAVSRQFESARGDAPRLQLTILPFIEALSQGLDLFATVVVAVLLMILIVISANVANLVLARSMARSTELAIRTALGASRAQLVGQIFGEVLLLGGLAAVIGLVASQSMLRWITLSLTDMPFWVDFSARPGTVAFVVVATLLAAAIGGVLPALRATSRPPAINMAGAHTTSGRFGWIGSTMIAVQITLSIALLNAALVMARGVAGYRAGGPTLPGSQLITARVSVEGGSTFESLGAIRRGLESLPGVESAGLASSLPRLSPPTVMTLVREGLGSPESAGQSAPMVEVTEGFLETLGGRATVGRLFDATDFFDRAPAVAIVNEPFVRRFFGGGNPVGKQLRVVDSDRTKDEPWREIVGVVPDLGLSAGDPALAAGFYIPFSIGTPLHYAAVRLPSGAELTDAALRAALVRVDSRTIVRDVRPIESVGSEDRAVFAGIAAALTGLGGVALVLSVLGVYAMLSFSVSQRTREIAIRTALGASRARILRAVIGRSSIPLLAGAIAGPFLASVFVAARTIFAFRLPADSGPFGVPVIGAMMIAAGLAATWIPTRRALRLTPSDTLRN